MDCSHLHFGIVTDVKAGFAKVSFLEDNFVSDWLPIAMHGTQKNKQCYPLNVNEQVACLMDANHETGVIIGATYNTEDTVPDEAGDGKYVMKFSDGTLILYDIAAKKLTAQLAGDADITAQGNVTINITGNANVQAKNVTLNAESVKIEADDFEVTAPSMKMTGALQVVGEISTGGITTSTTLGSGKMTGDGDIITTGDIKSNNVSLADHVHTGVTTGGGVSGPPKID